MTITQALSIVIKKCGGKFAGMFIDDKTNEAIYLFDCGDGIISRIREEVVFKMARTLIGA